MQNTQNEKVPDNKTKKLMRNGKKRVVIEGYYKHKSKRKAMCEEGQIQIV
jgi:hypothetical protein